MTTKIQTANIGNRKNNDRVTFKNYLDIPNPTPYLNVVQSGCRFKGSSGYKTRVNIYDHYVIHYITSGKGVYVLNGTAFPVEKGNLFLIPPYQTNYYIADELTPYTYYWVGFEGLDALELLNLTKFQTTPVISDKGESLTTLFKNLFEVSGNSVAVKYALNGYLQIILSKLMETTSQMSPKQNPYYSKAIDYITKYYDDPELNVQKVAKHVGVTRSYLYRIFFKANNHSINHSILNVRLSKAIALLANPTLSIKEIAYKTGFNSQAYFTKQFKREFKCSPSEYRQNKE